MLRVTRLLLPQERHHPPAPREPGQPLSQPHPVQITDPQPQPLHPHTTRGQLPRQRLRPHIQRTSGLHQQPAARQIAHLVGGHRVPGDLVPQAVGGGALGALSPGAGPFGVLHPVAVPGEGVGRQVGGACVGVGVEGVPVDPAAVRPEPGQGGHRASRLRPVAAQQCHRECAVPAGLVDGADQVRVRAEFHEAGHFLCPHPCDGVREPDCSPYLVRPVGGGERDDGLAGEGGDDRQLWACVGH